ncbi:MAG: hypothetical protein LBK00_08010 [Treponema sp.]|nr:hypothetical protein [Treponema sp.]
MKKLRLADIFTDKESMKLAGEYLTISEIAERLEITYLTAKQRLLRAGIKLMVKDVLYDPAALEAIRNVSVKGRPPKKKPDKADK